MSPSNTQTVYTVLDVLALILPALLAATAAAGIFAGGARASGGGLLCAIFATSMTWLTLRGFGVIA